MIAATSITDLQKQAARYNDPLAYKQLFLLFYQPLAQFAFSIIKSRELAEEIVSDVFLNIWKKRKQLDRISNLKVYLYVATKNIALNYISRQKRVSTISIDDTDMELESMSFNPEQLFITGEMATLIREAVQQLPPRCRLIFKLVKEDRLKYKEVAHILKISVKTIEKQITISLRRIGQAIPFEIRKSILSANRTSIKK